MKTATQVEVALPRATRGGWIAIILILVGGSALKLWFWMQAYGFEQGDPLEYLNIAHSIAFQTGERWWDIRPILYPLLLVPTLWIGQLLPDPTGEATVKAVRLFPLICSVATLAVLIMLGHAIGSTASGIAGAAMLAVSPIFTQLSVSPFAEVPATLCVLVAIWALMTAERDHRRYLLAGLAMSIGAMIRYQSLAFIAPLALWVLFRGARPLAAFGIGLGTCTALQAGLDVAVYGRPFHSLIQSARYNVTSDAAAAFYGATPPTWFLETVPGWLGLTAAVLALMGGSVGLLNGRRREWLLIVGAAGVMLVWLSLLAHKEARFTAQVSPLLFLAAGHGVVIVSSLLGKLRLVAAVALIGAAVAPSVAALPGQALTFNIGYVDGPKRVAAEQPGATLASIPWFIARPYTAGRLNLVRGDIDRWRDRQYITGVFNAADYVLLPEYDFASDREIQRLVDGQYRTLETYPGQVVLLQRRSRPQR